MRERASLSSFGITAGLLAAFGVGCVGWHSGNAGGFPAIEPKAGGAATHAKLWVDFDAQSFERKGLLYPAVNDPAFSAIDDAARAHGLDAAKSAADADYVLALQVRDGWKSSSFEGRLVMGCVLFLTVYPCWETHDVTVHATLRRRDGVALGEQDLAEDFTVLVELFTAAGYPLGGKTPGDDAKAMWRSVGDDLARWSRFEIDRADRYAREN